MTEIVRAAHPHALQQENRSMRQQADMKTGKNTWAAEVEKEHDAASLADLPSHSVPADGVGKKSKNKKKKKNRNKDAASSTKAESDGDKPLQENSERDNVVESEEVHDGKVQGEILEHSTGQQWGANNSAHTYSFNSFNSQTLNQGLQTEEGWEVASSRKSRRNEDAQRNQYGSSIHTPGWARGGNSTNGVGRTSSPAQGRGAGGLRPQAWRSSETAAERVRRPEAPGLGHQKPKAPTSQDPGEDKWETVAKIKGKGKNYMQKGGTNNTGVLENEFWGNRSLDTHQSGLMGSGSVADSVPVSKGPEVTATFKGQSIPPPPAGVWQWGNTHSDGKSSVANTAWSNPKRRIEDPQILSKLLPSEKQAGLGESIHAVGNAGSKENISSVMLDDLPSSIHSDSICSEDDLEGDSDWVGSDDFDSDGSNVSHDTKKKDKWFRLFFDTMATLTIEQLNEHDRQWHCPSCQGGVGAIDWYRGLQPLLAHAKTVRSKRVKLHRNFAKILEEELKRCGAFSGLTDEAMFGKWKGLREDSETVNPLIVWPPMVIIQNTKLELDDQEKWIGMGNKELLDLFKDYNVAKARHAYGPYGHRGMSVLVFADSPTGYMDAQRLEKHFKDARRGRENWDQPGKVLFYPGGNRILYGYTPTAEDMEIFNRHSGKSKLKWGLRRLQEAVVEPMRQMDEDNHQLNWLKQKVQKQKEHSKTLEKTVSLVTRKLKLRDEEIQIIRKRAQEQHDENQKEMDDLENTYKIRLNQLVNSRAKREEELQKKEEDFKHEQIRHVQQLEKTCAEIPKNKKLGEDQQHQQQAKMEEEIARKSELVEMSLKDSEDYESQKRDVMRKHHAKKVEFMRQQYERLLSFEKELEKERVELQERYLRQRQEVESKIDKLQ